MAWFSKKEKTYTKNEVDWLINELQTNEALNSSARSNISSILSGSNFTGDTLHQISVDFGYPDVLSFQNYWNMYRRFGIAKNLVHSVPDICWITPPEIEATPQFLSDLDILINNLYFWQRLKGLDTRQRVGRYAGLFMRVRDGLQPREPLEQMLPGVGALIQIIPLYESQLVVNEVVNDVMSDDYGQPKMYHFNGGAVGSRDEKNNNSFEIHPSRVIISAEGADNGDIYGISELEACYNSLMDLRKILGSGGEGFYKNAAKDVIFQLKDAATAKQNASLLAKFNENYDDWARNRARRSLWTPGLEAKVLDSNLIEPSEFFISSLSDVSASSGIPTSILTGNQTGTLAGDQDTKKFLTVNQSRRENFLNEMIGRVFDWCMLNGILPQSKYNIEWDDLRENSDADKLDLSFKMAEIVEKQFRAGQEISFSGGEIREQAGYEAEDLPEPSEAVIDEDIQE